RAGDVAGVARAQVDRGGAGRAAGRGQRADLDRVRLAAPVGRARGDGPVDRRRGPVGLTLGEVAVEVLRRGGHLSRAAADDPAGRGRWLQTELPDLCGQSDTLSPPPSQQSQGTQGYRDQRVTFSSISVTSAAIGDRSDRVSVTWAKSGCPFSFSITATTPSC